MACPFERGSTTGYTEREDPRGRRRDAGRRQQRGAAVPGIVQSHHPQTGIGSDGSWGKRWLGWVVKGSRTRR